MVESLKEKRDRRRGYELAGRDNTGLHFPIHELVDREPPNPLSAYNTYLQALHIA